MDKDQDLQDIPPQQDESAPLTMTPPQEDEAPSVAEPEPEPQPEPDHIVLLFGGGHMAQEVARQAHRAGFAVDVLDTREEYAAAERFPQARRVLLCEDYAELDSVCVLDARHYVVILTHSYETDMTVLLHSLDSPARYIGVAGSPRKKESLFTQLRERGLPDAELACVRCPIGLDIGAESVEEMGIAITAELIAARAGCLPRPRPRR